MTDRSVINQLKHQNLSPRSKIEFEQIRKDSKQKILDTALKLFGTNGFANTSISMIAKEAGISKGLMYNYFDSKDQLLEAIMLSVMEQMDELYKEVYAEPDPKILFRNMVYLTVKFLKEERDFNALILSLGLQKSTHELINKISEQKIKEMMPFMQNVLHQLGFDNPNEVFLLGAAFDGMATQYLVTDDDQLLDNIANALINKYLNESV